MTQIPDAVEECADRVELPEAHAVPALQDLLNAESPLLAGLIVHRFQPALQDDMASTPPLLAAATTSNSSLRCRVHESASSDDSVCRYNGGAIETMRP